MSTRTIDSFGNNSNTNSKKVLKQPEIQEEDISYDTAFKNVFSRKDVLAGILINIVPEYKKLTRKCVMELIEDIKETTEDISYEKKVFFDIVVTCKLPNGKDKFAVELHFNLEMQRQFGSCAKLMKRSVYYASRMLARQTVSDMHYERLQPVYSVWICIYDIPRYLEDTVQSFHLVTDSSSKSSKVLELEEAAKFFNVSLIFLSEEYVKDVDDDVLIKYLQSIFKNCLDDRDLNPYLDPDADLRKGVEMFMTKTEEYEIERREYREKVYQEGMQKGIQKGMQETILKATFSMYKSDMKIDDIIHLLCIQFNLTEEEALAYLQKAKQKSC